MPYRRLGERRRGLGQPLGSPIGGLKGYDWYVDGDIVPGGDGKSLVTAFQTAAEVEAVMSAGESVWIEPLDDGSPYREALDLSALDNVKVYSSLILTPTYDGDGFLTAMTISTAGAKLDCRDIIANATFAKTGGLVNVYEKSVTFDTGDADPQVKIWEDGTPLALVANSAVCDATAGSYYIAAHNVSPQTVYVHASDSSDITTNEKVYEYNPRAAALLLGNNCTIRGIHTLGNLRGSGSIVAGDGLTASHFVCEQGTKHNLYHGENCNISDFWLYNAYWYGAGATMAIYNKGTATGLPITYMRGLAESDDGFGANLTGYHGHVNVAGMYGTVRYNTVSCVGLTGGSGFQGADTASIIWNNCYISNTLYGFGLFDADPTYTVQDCKMVCSLSGRRGVHIGVNAPKLVVSGYDIDFSGGASGSSGIYLSNATTPTVTVDGLDITGTAGWTYGIYHTGAGGTVSVVNSNFDTLYRFYNTNAAAAAITSDYNNFAQDMASYIQGSAYANVAAYKAGTGQDAHSTIGA